MITETYKEKCLNCNNFDIIHDPERGEIVCQKCGYVVSKKLAKNINNRYYNEEEKRKKTINNDYFSPLYIILGLNSKIGNPNIDIKGIRLSTKQFYKAIRLRNVQNKLFLLDNPTLSDGLRILKCLISTLSLPRCVFETALIVFYKSYKHSLLRGRSIELVAGTSVYIACRIRRNPLTLKEIPKLMDISEKEFKKCYSKLVRYLKIEIPIQNLVDYIPRYCTDLGINGKTQKRVINIIKEAKEKGLTISKDPLSLIAAAIYMACKEEKIDIIQKRIARTTGCSVTSLQNHYYEFKIIME